MKYKNITLIFIAMTFSTSIFAREIRLNSVTMTNAPSWLTERRLQKVVDQIQNFLEWDIRRVTAIWYSSSAEFQKMHGYGSSVRAVSRKSDNTIHIGPLVNSENFDGVFGHELTHIIVFQKYKEAIPHWLEEGLANYAAKRKVTSYQPLKGFPIGDIHQLTHPFKGVTNPELHYLASTALMEMIVAKCPVHDLLQLSVGKNLETYLSTFCGFTDLNRVSRNGLIEKLIKFFIY